MRLLIILALIAQFFNLKAQDHSFFFGMLPEASLSFAAYKDVQITVKAESMQDYYSGGLEESGSWKYSYRSTDFQFFTGYRLNPFWSVAVGYQFGLEDGGNYDHRLIQQAAYVQRRIGYRLGHRIRTDQTFSEAENTEFRLRYRFSFELPLQGQEVDPGEFYLVASDEPIFSLQNNEKDIENRVIVKAGYYFNSIHRLEAGLDYRIDRFLESGSRNTLWFKMGWRVKL